MRPKVAQRPKFREVPQRLVLAFLKGMRLLEGAVTPFREYLKTGDPWAFLKAAGIRNWWPLQHEAKGTPTRTHYERHENEYKDLEEAPFDVLILKPFAPAQTRKTLDPNAIPLGPEDYELGAYADPSDPDPRLEAAFQKEAPSHNRAP